MNWELSVIMSSIVLALAVIIGAIVHVNDYDDDAMNAMVSKGWSPVQARCAVKGMTDSMCADQVKK